MASAKEAKEWAPEHLRGIIDSIYTPFKGKWGEEIDYDALRKLVKYCIGDLKHAGIMTTAGNGEYWALTVDERKKILEVVIEEARQINPKALIKPHTGCLPAKDCVELTNHAKAVGADIVSIITPYVEVSGFPGVREFYRYVAEHTDIAISLFNAPATGILLSPQEVAKLYHEIPAICAIKNGQRQYPHSVELHRVCPEIPVWECDLIAAGMGGLMKYGITAPGIWGHVSYALETPSKPILTEHWKLLMEGKLTEAAEQYYKSGLDIVEETVLMGVRCADRPGYFIHTGSWWKYLATLLGLPPGEWPFSRPPQTVVPEEAKRKGREAFIKVGFIKA